MHYEEHPAPAALRAQLECLWRLRAAPGDAALQTLYPDGRCELILHLAQPPLLRTADGGWQAQARLLFAAQTRRALQLQTQGALHCVGLRLQPAASAALWPGPLGAERLRAWQDQVVDLSVCEPAWWSELTPALAETHAGAFPGPQLLDWLSLRLAAFRPDPCMQLACQLLDASNGRSSVAALAQQLGCGLRSLQTRFVAAVGLSPKEYARIRRLQACIRLLDGGGLAPAAAALEAGFADQAHATRALRDFAGLTPARLRKALATQRDGEASLALAAAFVRGKST